MNTRRFLLPTLVLAFLSLAGSPSGAQQDAAKQSAIQVSQPKSNSNPKDDPAETKSVPPLAPPQAHRIKAIEQRIDIIKEIMLRKQAQAMEAAKASEPIPANPAADPVATPAPEQTNAQPPISRDAPENLDAPSTATEPELPATGPERMEPEKPSVNQLLEQFQIGTSPLNSLELANSLYVTGNYSQALKGYEALLEAETATLDQDWLRCLAANCYRVQGQVAKAEKLYRDVVASKEKSYPADQAKWYLDHLTRKKKIQSEIDLLNSELQPFQNDTSKQGP